MDVSVTSCWRDRLGRGRVIANAGRRNSRKNHVINRTQDSDPSHRLKNWPVLGQVEFAVDTKVIWNTSVSNLVIGRWEWSHNGFWFHCDGQGVLVEGGCVGLKGRKKQMSNYGIYIWKDILDSVECSLFKVTRICCLFTDIICSWLWIFVL